MGIYRIQIVKTPVLLMQNRTIFDREPFEMGKVIKVKIRKLRMMELLTFCEHVLYILAPLQLSTPIFQNFMKKFLELKSYCDKQQQIKTSYLFNVDEDLCHASRAFRTMLLACSLHPKKEMRDAAESVSQLLPEIVNPKRLTHDTMYTRAQNVLESLNSLPTERVEQLFLTDYLAEFKRALVAFIDAYNHKQEVIKEHVTQDGMALMRSLIALANDLFKYLDLVYRYDMPESGKKIIDNLNDYINSINAKM